MSFSDLVRVTITYLGLTLTMGSPARPYARNLTEDLTTVFFLSMLSSTLCNGELKDITAKQLRTFLSILFLKKIDILGRGALNRINTV